MKDLKNILNDFRYLVTTGFTEVYPLLFPYLKLTYHLQNDDISCVHAVLIVERYLNEMIENIIKYNISERAYELINLIEKRLLLNKNVQLYQLASLFTLEGIVRYRSYMKGQYKIYENDDFWHNNEGFMQTQFNLSFQDINSFKDNELNYFLQILDQFESKKPVLKTKRKKKAKTNLVKKIIQNFPQQTQLSLDKYIQNAQDTFNAYRKFNKNNPLSYIPENTTSENKTEVVDQSQTNNDSKLTNSSESSDCEFLKSNDLSGYHTRKESVNEDNQFESSFENIQNENSDAAKNNSEISIENSIDDSSDNDKFSNSSSTSSDDEPDKNLFIKEKIRETDMICKDKEYKYFDQKDESENEQESEEIILDGECYKTRKDALCWNNISKLIVENATYFELSETEANKAVMELHKLILTPFSTIRSFNQTAVCSDSDFMNFWSVISELTINGVSFENISKIAFRLWPIPPSEAGAERAYSKIKWKFPDRRNRIKDSTMMDEIYVEDAYQQRTNNGNDFSEAMWQLPQHSTS